MNKLPKCQNSKCKKRVKVGPEWHVVATYPMGGKEHIIGFRSEAEALAWMKSDRCAAWVKARGYG